MPQLITTPSQLGHIFARRRKALRQPQQAVAAKLGISQGRLSTLEENPSRLTLDRLIALANILGFELIIQDKAGPSGSPSEW